MPSPIPEKNSVYQSHKRTKQKEISYQDLDLIKEESKDTRTRKGSQKVTKFNTNVGNVSQIFDDDESSKDNSSNENETCTDENYIQFSENSFSRSRVSKMKDP